MTTHNNFGREVPVSIPPAFATDTHWRSEFFKDWELDEDYEDGDAIPLSAIHGPHSSKISAILATQPWLSEFADGVDERLVSTERGLPFALSAFDWPDENDGQPITLAFYIPDLDSYYVACVKMHRTPHPTDDKYKIVIKALLKLHMWKGSSHIEELYSSENLCEFDDFELHVNAEEDEVHCDFLKLRYLMDDEVSPISMVDFIIETLCNPMTYTYWPSRINRTPCLESA